MANEEEAVNFWSRRAVLYKSFYFVFYAGYYPFLLYVPVYLKYLGLSAIQVGLINGIRSLMQTIGAPLWGIVADKYRIRRSIFTTAFVLMTIKTMLFLLFRPRHQMCVESLVDKSKHIIRNRTSVIEHGITKRSSTRNGVDVNAMQLAITANMKREKLGQISSQPHNINTATVSRQSISSKSQASGQSNGLNKTMITFEQVPRELHKNSTSKNASLFLMYKIVIDEDETAKIFSGILLLIVLGETFDGAVFTLADTSCLDTHGTSNYGYYRLWGSAGWGIMAPIIGVIIHHFTTTKCDVQVGAYFCIFYFYLAFMYLALLFGSYFEFENKSHGGGEVETTVKSALLNFHYGMFLFVTFYAGFCYGFLLYFVNWFIDSLGGSARIMGLATACKSVVDVLLFFLSVKVIGVLGHLNAVTISLVAYIVAFVSYSYTTNPWYTVPIEVLHSGAYALVWSSSVSYLNKAAPAGSSAIVQGILQGVYWGLGTGGGTIIGGYVIHTYGFVATFRAFAVTTAIVLAVFIMTQLLSKISSLDDDSSEKEASLPKEEPSHSDDENVYLLAGSAKTESNNKRAH